MEFKKQRVTLRPITIEDLPDCTRWAQDKKVMHHVIQRTFTPEQEREWLEGILRSDQEKVYMIFKEVEGTTIIIKEELVRTLNGQTPRWAMITLTVHSDLNAVGFLAAITRRLADAGISVNPVSAFYHDHLFVPFEKREATMEILRSFSKST